MSGSTFLTHALEEKANWWMNLFLSLFYREQLQKKAHPALSHGIQVRHAKRFIRWWVSLSDIWEIAQGFWRDHVRPLLFLRTKEKSYYFLLHILSPVPIGVIHAKWKKLHLSATRHQGKIRGRNGNVTKRLCFKSPLIFCTSFVFMLLWHKSYADAAHVQEERILLKLQ